MRDFLTWLCVAGLNFFLTCGNCAEQSRSVFQTLAAIERPDGTVDQLKLWTQLGVKSNLFQNERPTVAIFTLKSGDNWKLLRLSDMWPDECQYLLFRIDAKGMWHFCGNIDFTDVHYEMPEHRLQQIGNRTWLTIKHIKGSGTDFIAREEAWYPLNDSFGVCELSYLHNGYFNNEEYALLNQKCTVTNGKPAVELLHSVTGKTANDRVHYKKELRTRFVWSDKKMKFEASQPVADKSLVRWYE